MRTLIFIAFIFFQSKSSAGEIYNVFGGGVFETKWGQTLQDIQKTFPSAKTKHYGDITQIIIEDDRKVFGLERDAKSKIHFAFDSEERLNGVAVYFTDDQFSTLLNKLQTLFGEYATTGSTGVTYMQWKQDNYVTITLSVVPTPNDVNTVFSIGYFGLAKPGKSKKELGF